jgi:hypothetical protein
LRRDVCELPVRIAAVVIPAVVVVDEAAGALRSSAARNRKAGRLIGQESATRKILDGLACMGAFAHLDTVECFACGLPRNGRFLRLFPAGNPAPPERDNSQQQDKHKNLRHFTDPFSISP